MKIYEIRDITDDEAYFTKRYCFTAKEAIDSLTLEAEGIYDGADDADLIIGAVFEHELGVWSHQPGFDRKIFEIRFTRQYSEESDDMNWTSEITKAFNGN